MTGPICGLKCVPQKPSEWRLPCALLIAVTLLTGCGSVHPYELGKGYVGVYAIDGHTVQGCLQLQDLELGTTSDTVLILIQAEPVAGDIDFPMRYANTLERFARRDSVVEVEVDIRVDETGRKLALIDTLAIDPDGHWELAGPLAYTLPSMATSAYPDSMVSSEELNVIRSDGDCVAMYWIDSIDLLGELYNSGNMSDLRLIVSGLAIMVPRARLLSAVGRMPWFVQCTIKRQLKGGHAAPEVVLRSRRFRE